MQGAGVVNAGRQAAALRARRLMRGAGVVNAGLMNDGRKPPIRARGTSEQGTGVQHRLSLCCIFCPESCQAPVSRIVPSQQAASQSLIRCCAMSILKAVDPATTAQAAQLLTRRPLEHVKQLGSAHRGGIPASSTELAEPAELRNSMGRLCAKQLCIPVSSLARVRSRKIDLLASRVHLCKKLEVSCAFGQRTGRWRPS